MALVTSPCLVCGCQAHWAFTARESQQTSGDDQFPYYLCNKCGSYWLDPIPQDLGSYYHDHYPAHQYPQDRATLAAQAQKSKHRIDLVLQYVTSGDLLEIGPGYGKFCYLAQEAGFKVSAIEMDAACCEFMQRTLAISVDHTNDVLQALQKQKPESFDALCMWHNLEHLPQAGSILAQCAELIRVGGVFVVACPNPSSLQMMLLGKRWMHLDAPRHVNLISMVALQKLLLPLGFELMLQTTRDPDSMDLSRYSWAGSLRYCSGFKPFQIGLRILGKLLRLSLGYFEDRNHRGASYTMVFKKIMPRKV